MSKGFGKIQTKILEFMKYFNSKIEISYVISEISGRDATTSQKQSIWRAIRKLEKLGIVETKKHKFTGMNCNWAYRPFKEYQIYDLDMGWITKKYRPRGGQSHFKLINFTKNGKNTLN